MTVALIATVTAFPIKASATWNQSDIGNWSYTQGDTSVSDWKSIDGKWYFFNSNATMKIVRLVMEQNGIKLIHQVLCKLVGYLIMVYGIT